ncbi:MAG: hypothetical protein ACYTEQ_24815 [Planctomycetota bacterium]|jgi:hypothetical protein
MLYGSVYQPLMGGGLSYGGSWRGAIEVGKSSGLAEGAKAYVTLLVSNYTGYRMGGKFSQAGGLEAGWNAEGLKEGWLPLAAGYVGDRVARFAKVQKLANKGAKAIGTKYRWTVS